MKTLVVIAAAISLAANAVLLALHVWASDPPTSSEDASVARAPLSLETIAVAGPEEGPNGLQSIAASRFAALATHLRTAGFPPHVIRGMINAALDEQFAARRRAIFARYPLPPFWMPQPFDSAMRRELRAVDREQQDLLRQLLGPGAFTEPMQAARRARFGDLPDDKLDALERLGQDYDDVLSQLRAELRGDGSPGIDLPWEQEQLTAVEREKRTDLQELLTPEELRQYDLRNSRSSQVLRSRLTLLDLTEAEFVALHDVFNNDFEKLGPGATLITFSSSGSGAIQSGIAVVMPGAMISPEARATVQQTNERVKAALGESRFEDFQRALDSGYRTARALTDRLGLPQQTANAVYDLQRSVQTVTTEMRRAPGQTPAQRAESFAALLRETEAKLLEHLGPRGTEAYKNASPSWIRALENAARPPAPRPPAPGN